MILARPDARRAGAAPQEANVDVTTHSLGDDGRGSPGIDAGWESVLASDPASTPFQGPVWIRAWASRRAPGPVRVRVVGSLQDPVGVLPEVDLGDGHLTTPGGTDVTDYRGPVARDGERNRVAAAWLRSLAEDGVSRYDLHGIPEDAGWLDALADQGSTSGWTLEEREQEDVCPRVAIPAGDADAWLEALDAKERHELRRKSRKLARDLGGMRVAEADDLAAALDRFLELAVTAAGDKGEFFRDPGMRDFFTAIVEALGADGTLRIHELLVGDLPAASMVSITDRTHREWGLYNSALDETLAAFAPGTVLASELCTEAAREGFETFDFLRGDEAYKYRFGAVDRVIERATLRRNG